MRVLLLKKRKIQLLNEKGGYRQKRAQQTTTCLPEESLQFRQPDDFVEAQP